MQAAIAACHVAALYDALTQLAASPIVELNRAVALSMAYGPAAGIEMVDALTSEPARGRALLLERARAVRP